MQQKGCESSIIRIPILPSNFVELSINAVDFCVRQSISVNGKCQLSKKKKIIQHIYKVYIESRRIEYMNLSLFTGQTKKSLMHANALQGIRDAISFIYIRNKRKIKIHIPMYKSGWVRKMVQLRALHFYIFYRDPAWHWLAQFLLKHVRVLYDVLYTQSVARTTKIFNKLYFKEYLCVRI